MFRCIWNNEGDCEYHGLQCDEYYGKHKDIAKWDEDDGSCYVPGVMTPPVLKAIQGDPDYKPSSKEDMVVFRIRPKNRRNR